MQAPGRRYFASFHELGVPTFVTRGLKFDTASPIQKLVIPRLLRPWDKEKQGYKPVSDVIVHSQTGSGKSLAFLLPLISTIDKSQAALQGIVVAPTRELATQLGKVAESLAAGTASTKKKGASKRPVRVKTVVGDVNPFMTASIFSPPEDPDAEGASKLPPQLLIGTPLLVDYLLHEGVLDASLVHTCVLDEVDYLLAQPSASKQVERVIAICLQPVHPPRARGALQEASQGAPVITPKQVVVASATVNEEVKRFMARVRGLRPEGLDAAPETKYISTNGGAQKQSNSKIPSGIKHYHLPFSVHPSHALKTRASLLLDTVVSLTLGQGKGKLVNTATRAYGTVLVFFNYFERVAHLRLAEKLEEKGLKVASIFRVASRTSRRAAGGGVGSADVILVSDAMARGMHFPGLSHVINFEPPPSRTLYVHRAGRVGRLRGMAETQRKDASVITLINQGLTAGQSEGQSEDEDKQEKDKQKKDKQEKEKGRGPLEDVDETAILAKYATGSGFTSRALVLDHAKGELRVSNARDEAISK